MKTDTVASSLKCLIRNITIILWPIEVIVVLVSPSRRIGDFIAGTEWPNPRFSMNDDCVLDNLTGLMWAKNANIPNQTLPWQDGLDYIKSLNAAGGLCGYTDWRMPNSLELVSLVNL